MSYFVCSHLSSAPPRGRYFFQALIIGLFALVYGDDDLGAFVPCVLISAILACACAAFFLCVEYGSFGNSLLVVMGSVCALASYTDCLLGPCSAKFWANCYTHGHWLEGGSLKHILRTPYPNT